MLPLKHFSQLLVYRCTHSVFFPLKVKWWLLSFCPINVCYPVCGFNSGCQFYIVGDTFSGNEWCRWIMVFYMTWTPHYLYKPLWWNCSVQYVLDLFSSRVFKVFQSSAEDEVATKGTVFVSVWIKTTGIVEMILWLYYNFLIGMKEHIRYWSKQHLVIIFKVILMKEYITYILFFLMKTSYCSVCLWEQCCCPKTNHFEEFSPIYPTGPPLFFCSDVTSSDLRDERSRTWWWAQLFSTCFFQWNLYFHCLGDTFSLCVGF